MRNAQALAGRKAAMKEVKDLASEGKTKEAEEKLPEAYKAIDKAAKRGVIKSNNADRKKSLLVKFIESKKEKKEDKKVEKKAAKKEKKEDK